MGLSPPHTYPPHPQGFPTGQGSRVGGPGHPSRQQLLMKPVRYLIDCPPPGLLSPPLSGDAQTDPMTCPRSSRHKGPGIRTQVCGFRAHLPSRRPAGSLTDKTPETGPARPALPAPATACSPPAPPAWSPAPTPQLKQTRSQGLLCTLPGWPASYEALKPHPAGRLGLVASPARIPSSFPAEMQLYPRGGHHCPPPPRARPTNPVPVRPAAEGLLRWGAGGV